MKTKLGIVWLIIAGCLLVGGCNYEFSLTAQPTRKINEQLLGNWASFDKDEQKVEHLNVRRWDEFTYVVAMDGDIYRVFHSDVADTAFLSVQNLRPGSDDRKYAYYTWQLSADGTELSLKGVSNKVVPEETKERDEIQKLIKNNLTNPNLFGDVIVYSRKKS